MAGDERETPRQGLRLDGAEPAELAAAIRNVVDYRGDVTITRRSGGEPVTGYVFDCRDADDPERAAIRLTVEPRIVRGIGKTGRGDPATGGAVDAGRIDEELAFGVGGRSKGSRGHDNNTIIHRTA